MNRYPVTINTRFVEDLEEDLFSENGSKRYDEDWSRLVGCKDLRDGNSPLRGTVFKLGSMTGLLGRSFLVTILSPSIKVISHTKPRRLHSMSRCLRVDWVTTDPG